MTNSASAAATSPALNYAILSTFATNPRKRSSAKPAPHASAAFFSLGDASTEAYCEPSTQPPSDAPEGRELARRDRIVLEHLDLVKAIAYAIRKSLPTYVDCDDLVQAGTLGLIDAADKYDSTKKIPFSAYAKHRIRGAILDSLRKLDWASRSTRRRHKLITEAVAQLTAEFKRAPLDSEIAGKLGIDLAACRRTMLELHNGAPVSSSYYNGDDKDLPEPKTAGGHETQPEFICLHQEMRGVLDEALKTLPERHQKVVLMYYRKDMSMKEIGSALNVNESRVSQIHKAALAKMAVTLKANGIASHTSLID
jgi:RNA polymerase sigma factor for flagellar operon FliA